MFEQEIELEEAGADGHGVVDVVVLRRVLVVDDGLQLVTGRFNELLAYTDQLCPTRRERETENTNIIIFWQSRQRKNIRSQLSVSLNELNHFEVIFFKGFSNGKKVISNSKIR